MKPSKVEGRRKSKMVRNSAKPKKSESDFFGLALIHLLVICCGIRSAEFVLVALFEPCDNCQVQRWRRDQNKDRALVAPPNFV